MGVGSTWSNTMTVDDKHPPTRGSLFRHDDGTRPTGDVAFLFTDLQGSVTAWEREPDAMNDVLARHDETLRRAIVDFRGAVFSVAGDAFGAGFHTIDDAVQCAVGAQLALAALDWPSGLAPKVRMGLHIGRAFERDGNYFGPTPNRAARIMSAAHGGQVLVSDDAVQALAAVPDGVALESLGRFLLRDLTEPLGLHQLSIASLRVEYPPLRATSESSRILRPSSTFVARESELAELSVLVASNPLVTVVAAGGTGKTRLALELAATVGHRFPVGAVAVELADGGENDVVPRLAEAVLGNDAAARTEAATDLLHAITRHLAGQRALIVLDNCEHVLPTVTRVVAALTRHCPDVAVLATSRERLGVDGERVLLLEPLSTVRRNHMVAPATELFLDRAVTANPGIVVDDAALQAIETICAAVEGSPLGIELAAARVRTLTPRQIAERLVDDLQLLRQRHSNAPERHRSLDAAIAWSYELLEPDERRLLAWSSVFVGGFEVAAAETIGSAAGIPDVIDVIESLVEKSLLAAQHVGAHMRYRLAEPIRQFARARLDEFEQLDLALESHFDHCRSAARDAVTQLDGHVDPPLFTSLSAELENFLAAIHRAADRGAHKSAMSLASSLDLYWAETVHIGVAMQVFDQLARRDPDHPDTSIIHVPMLWVATMAGELPRAQDIRDLLEAQMSEGLLNPIAVGGASFGIGFVESGCGDAMAAAKAWSLAARGAAPFVPALARQAYWSAGQSATAAGDNELALGLYLAADRLDAPTPGWWPTFVDTMRRVARTYQGEDHVDALHRGTVALEDTGLKMRFVLASAFVSLALFHSEAPDRADHWWRRSMSTAREIGNLWACWVMLECAAWSAMERGDDHAAALLWHAGDAFAGHRGYGLWPVVRDETDRRRAVVRVRTPAAFDELVGRPPLTLTEAIDIALQP